MANFTTNYNLKKPLANENYNIDDQNGNMDIIDVTLAGKETPIGAQSKADAALVAGKAYADQGLAGKISHSLATAANDFLVASGVGTFVKKTLAEVKSILGLGSAAYTNSNAYASAAQGTTADTTAATVTTHLADYVRQPGYGVTAGSANTYTVSTTPAPAAYVDGMGLVLRIHAANTGASTVNWDGLGAKAIVDGKGNALIAGKLPLGGRVSLRYSTAAGNFQLQGEGGEYGTAVASEVLEGKTIGTDAGLVTGIIPNMPYKNPDSLGMGRSLATYFSGGPSSVYLRPKQGYYDGVDTWTAYYDVNHIPANVKVGVTDLGVTGTLEPGLKVDDFAPDVSSVGKPATCIDNDYIYSTARGDYSPNMLKHNHAGTLISSYTASGLTGNYQGGTYSKYGIAFLHTSVSTNANMRIYDAIGTLLYNYNLPTSWNNSNNTPGFNGDLVISYDNKTPSPFRVKLYTASGTFLSQADTLVAPDGGSNWYLNIKETLVYIHNLNDVGKSPGYVLKGSTVLTALPTGFYNDMLAQIIFLTNR